uniref:Septum formation protein Maf n=1 Tax=Ditylum brightwellii TaxID=49249 RepID=A0A7S4SML7_9STRA
MRCNKLHRTTTEAHKHKRNSPKEKAFKLGISHSLIVAVLALTSHWSINFACAFSFVRSRGPTIALTMAAKEDSVNAGDKGRLLVSKFSSIGFSKSDGSNVRLILASQSPRRREILDMMGLTGRYTVNPSPLDESALQRELAAQPNLSPEEYARTLAEHKAQALGVEMVTTSSSEETEVTLILGSDTIVDLDGAILEKPVDESDARSMLGRLSGNWHKVHTGVAIYGLGLDDNQQPKLLTSFTDTARVKFADLTQKDISSYVSTGEPMDKAGSYGIQGVGGQLVEMIEGDFFAVMGLPMHTLSRELSRAIMLLDAK